MKELMLMRARGLSGPLMTSKAGLPSGKVAKSAGNRIGANTSYKQSILSAAGGLAPVAWLLPENIQDDGAGNVTAWLNDTLDATGGTDYDLGTQTGTPTVSSHSGKRVVESNGTANMQTAAAQVMAQPVTVLMVAKTRDSASTTLVLLDGHTSTGFRILRHSAGVWRANAGATIDVTAVDTDVNVHGLVANGVSSIYGVLNTTEQVDSGNIGANGFDYLTILASKSGANNFDGWVGEVIVFGAALSLQELVDVSAILADNWDIGPT